MVGGCTAHALHATHRTLTSSVGVPLGDSSGQPVIRRRGGARWCLPLRAARQLPAKSATVVRGRAQAAPSDPSERDDDGRSILGTAAAQQQQQQHAFPTHSTAPPGSRPAHRACCFAAAAAQSESVNRAKAPFIDPPAPPALPPCHERRAGSLPQFPFALTTNNNPSARAAHTHTHTHTQTRGALASPSEAFFCALRHGASLAWRKRSCGFVSPCSGNVA